MKRLFFATLLLISTTIYGQYIHIGGDNFAYAKSMIAEPSLWSVSGNQAGMPFLQNKINAGIYYENMFFIKELSLKSLALNWNSDDYGSFGLVINSFGYSEFNKNRIALAYAMKLTPKLSAGIALNYIFIHQSPPYDNIGVITGEIGLLFYPSDNFSVGMHIFNPWLAKVRITPNEYLPTIADLGIAYHPLDNVLFMASLTKNIELPLEINSGIGYKIINNLWIRTGFKVMNKDYFITAGIGYKYKFLTLNLGFENHPILGIKSAVSMNIAF